MPPRDDDVSQAVVQKIKTRQKSVFITRNNLSVKRKVVLFFMYYYTVDKYAISYKHK